MGSKKRMLFCGSLFLTVAFGFMAFVVGVAKLPRTHCTDYYKFKLGKGEMSYCQLEDGDDSGKIELSDERVSSNAYLLILPVKTMKESFNVQHMKRGTFERYHYLFPGDVINGTVECDKMCKFTIKSYWNSCANKKKSSYFTSGCSNTKTELMEETDTTFNFFYRATKEQYYRVQVESDSLLDRLTVQVETNYQVTHTVINTTEGWSCNNYDCKFSDIAGERHVLVNKIDTLSPEGYETKVTIGYRHNKARWVAVTAVLIALFCLSAIALVAMCFLATAAEKAIHYKNKGSVVAQPAPAAQPMQPVGPYSPAAAPMGGMPPAQTSPYAMPNETQQPAYNQSYPGGYPAPDPSQQQMYPVDASAPSVPSAPSAQSVD